MRRNSAYHQRRDRFFVVFTLVLTLESLLSLDAEQRGGRVLVGPRQARPRASHEFPVVRVAERPVAEVVAEARELDAEHVRVGQL